MANRPSFLQVDRWAIRGETRHLAELRSDPGWAAHLTALEATGPVPGWARDLERPRRRWVVGAGLVAAALAILLWVSRPPPYVGVKSHRLDVAIYLEDSEWDGTTPLEVGEGIRLRLLGPAHDYYAVLIDEDGALSVVDQGRWPVGGVLPGAWALDEPPHDTALVVVGSASDPEGRGPAAILEGAELFVRIPLDP